VLIAFVGTATAVIVLDILRVHAFMARLGRSANHPSVLTVIEAHRTFTIATGIGFLVLGSVVYALYPRLSSSKFGNYLAEKPAKLTYFVSLLGGLVFGAAVVLVDILFPPSLRTEL